MIFTENSGFKKKTFSAKNLHLHFFKTCLLPFLNKVSPMNFVKKKFIKTFKLIMELMTVINTQRYQLSQQQQQVIRIQQKIYIIQLIIKIQLKLHQHPRQHLISLKPQL